MTSPTPIIPVLLVTTAVWIAGSDRGQIVSQTDEAAVVRVDSYQMSCSGTPVEREARVGGAWEVLEERPWSGVVVDGERLPYSMCCIATCDRVEEATLDLRRYERVGTVGEEEVPAYESAPVGGPLRATFHLYADPVCAIPRTVRVTVNP